MKSKGKAEREPTARWRVVADRAKRSEGALRVADFLGRGKGRLRVLDRLACRAVLPAPRRPELGDWGTRGLSVVWLGHATMLVRIGGMTVLTDPVMGVKIGMGLGVMTAGPRRQVAVPIEERALPKIDVVAVSHAHFDHLDRPTLARLARGAAKGARVVISEGNSDLVGDLGYAGVDEVGVGATVEVKVGGSSLRVTGVPVRHWGARVFHDTHRGFCAYLFEGGGRRVLFGADSAYQEYWRPIGAAGGVDVCCVGIGAYNPWEASHATPEQAAAMAGFAGARVIVPMHWGTFKLSHEPMAEPMKRFRAAVQAERIGITEIGGEWTQGGR